MSWRKINLVRRTQNGEVHGWHFPKGPSPKVFLWRKMAPMFHLYVKLWCVHFQRIRVCQDKTSSKTGQRWKPPPITSCIVLAVSNLKAQFLKFCCISFTSISGYITINQRRNPWNQSAGMIHWLQAALWARGVVTFTVGGAPALPCSFWFPISSP